MILLVVIAVGLLSLSSISLRASGQASSGAIARENARLGMMIALGELQKNLGPDAAVSADSSVVMQSPQRPHLTGAWKRPADATLAADWHWSPSQNGAPKYSNKGDFFGGWLVSTAKVDDALDTNLPGNKLDISTDVVNLVGSTKVSEQLENNGVSNGVNANKVKLGPNGKWGRYAWGVFDESVKAPISLGDPTTVNGVGQEIAGRFAPVRVRGDIIEKMLEDSLKDPKNLISMDTAKIPVPGKQGSEEIQKRFHDFTTDSFGLLTDSATGGLRYDLTSAFEGDGKGLPSSASFGPYPSNFGADTGAPNWDFFRDLYKKYSFISKGNGTPSYRVNDSDLKIFSSGVQPSPTTQRLLPVLAKLQVAFSIVTHLEHIGGRMSFYNQYGGPGGNSNYGVVHLVYDPIVTLYNPYDVALNLDQLRIRIWDPPVGFKFTKISAEGGSQPFRPNNPTPTDAQNQGFYSLARFQSKWENDASARKAITMILTDGTNDAAGRSLKLLPGEVKVFSPRVDGDWTWGKETRDEYNPYAFFDWRSESNFGNVDHRTNNQMGMETVPGWTGRAGLSGDHLAFGARDGLTKYKFERDSPGAGNVTGAYVPIMLKTADLKSNADSVKVDVRVLHARERTKDTKSFQVDILAGRDPGNIDYKAVNSDSDNSGVAADRLRSYSFTFPGTPPDPRAEILAPGTPTTISRTYKANELLQSPTDSGPGGKKTIAMLEMSARATKDVTTDSKPWLFNNPVVEGAEQNSNFVGLANQSYDLRLYQMNGGFKNFPDGVDIDPDTFRGYFGASSARADGSSFVPMMHVPVAPMSSLGEMIHSTPVTSSNLPRVTHPFGNARAHPLIAPNTVVATGSTTMLDHSYLLNDSLWDRYYFSSITAYGSQAGSAFISEDRDRKTVLKNLIAGTKHAINNRIAPIVVSGEPDSLADDINGTSKEELPRKMATYFGISGPFNLNSTSVDAWRAVLSSLRDRQINGAALSGSDFSSKTYPLNGETPLVRTSLPLSGAIPKNASFSDPLRWGGFRSLNDDQIKSLATAIVVEIGKRGQEDHAPAFSIGEFVNRRLGTASGLHTLSGLLQTAIDNSGINQDYLTQDGKAVTYASVANARKKGVASPESMNGFTSEGTPSYITQGDLMAALAPVATVRGDTFKIRGYGEATDAGGNVIARAWCEAVVQRFPDYVDPTDAAEHEVKESGGSELTTVNQNFGRRFNVVSFRWLNDQEI